MHSITINIMCVTLVKVGAHHLTLGVVFIICGMIGLTSQRQIWILNIRPHMHSFGQSGQPGINQLGGQLCIALAICGYFSVTAAITSGLFQLWRSEGIITEVHLKYACSASVIRNCFCISGSYVWGVVLCVLFIHATITHTGGLTIMAWMMLVFWILENDMI